METRGSRATGGRDSAEKTEEEKEEKQRLVIRAILSISCLI